MTNEGSYGYFINKWSLRSNNIRIGGENIECVKPTNAKMLTAKPGQHTQDFFLHSAKSCKILLNGWIQAEAATTCQENFHHPSNDAIHTDTLMHCFGSFCRAAHGSQF